ncbi:CAP domain-containing protein [Rhizobium sp.]
MDYLPSRRLFLIGSGTTLLLSGCSVTTTLAPIETGSSVDTTETALPIVNAVRRKNGRASLFNDPVAANAAKDHAIRMARYGKMSHDLGSDRNFLARMKRMEVPLPAAENIATGQDSTEAAMTAWIRSKSHLDNILGPYTGVGVALAKNTGTGDRPYWAMVLSNSPGRFSFRI